MSGKRVPMTVKPQDLPAYAWVHAAEKARVGGRFKSELYRARLTIDITPELRKRLKIAAISNRLTVAAMVREVLEEVFGSANETPS